MSLRSFPVGIASSRRRKGKHFGLSWNARFILAFRWPNRVPVILVPPWMNASLARLPFIVGILHDGTMMGNDRNTERNFLKNLVDFESCLLLLFAGCKEIGTRRCGERPSVVAGVAVVVVTGKSPLDTGDDSLGGVGDAINFVFVVLR